MTRKISKQITELRQTMETYKVAADRYGRAAESSCLALAMEYLDRCERLVGLAIATSPDEEEVCAQASGPAPKR
jgi:hypothetical protein